MSIKKENLGKILNQYFKRAIDPLPKLQWGNLKNHPILPAIRDIYQELDGQYKNPGIFLPPWDFMLEGVIVQWDEYLHFNKYRLATLRSPLYDNCRAFQVQKYRSHCVKYQSECIKAGLVKNLWTNKKAEQQFGPSELAGDLGGRGSAAWKQRAFTDYLQDMSILILNQPMIRLSIHEEMLVSGKLTQIGDLLLNPNENEQEMVSKYIERRIEVATAFHEKN